MIVVDSSAVIAVLRKEPGFEAYVAVLDKEQSILMSRANFLEAAIVMLHRFGAPGLPRLYRMRDAVSLELRDVNATQLDFAIDAYSRFGRGSGHPARLNFGDCFAYALARATDAPLLFKGDDFSRTDIASVL